MSDTRGSAGAASGSTGAPPVTQLVLTDEMKAAVNGALMNGTPVVLGYVDKDGVPHLSLRGSAQAYGDHDLALWARNPEGGLLAALGSNRNVTLLYRDGATRTTLVFTGSARVERDSAFRDHVYMTTPELERNTDPDQRGEAVLIELDQITGSVSGTRFHMQRHRDLDETGT